VQPTGDGPLWASAVAACQRGDWNAAKAALRDFVGRASGHAEAWALLSEVEARLGHASAAAAAVAQAAKLRPADPAMQRRHGDALLGAGEAEAAVAAYRRATALEPGNARGFNNLGRALHASGSPGASLAAYREALKLKPDYPIARHNLALAHVALGDDEAALRVWRDALASEPELVEAWSASAAAWLRRGEARTALAHAEHALALRQPFADAERTRGIALAELREPEAAMAVLDALLARHPDDAGAHYARAKLCRDAGDADGARAGFRAALKAAPELDAARWSEAIAAIPALASSAAEAAAARRALAAALDELDAHWSSTGPADPPSTVAASLPFYLAYQEADNRPLLARHGQLAARLLAGWQAAAPAVSAAPVRDRGDRRLCVAIVSTHVHEHSVYRALTRGWLRHLDRARFRVEVYSLGSRRDAATDEAEALADGFTQGARGFADWVRAIGAARPDAILYPELGMDPASYRLAALRLAPLQAVSWGHPDTSGLPTVDAYLSAEAFEPVGAASHYTETLVRLPGIGCCYEPAPAVTATAPAAPEPDSVEFLCPGTPFKYAPEHDGIYAELIRRIGACRFHFFRDSPLSDRLVARIAGSLAAAGFSPERHLVLHPWAGAAEFAGWLERADLMLDTLGFSGFNTVMQALGRGLPVVTLRGRFLRGRLGSGILEAIGADELVAADPAAYVAIAAALALEAPRRRALRAGLAARAAALHGDVRPVAALGDWLEATLGTRPRAA
jgi:protein O-GlcNAc transferase